MKSFVFSCIGWALACAGSLAVPSLTWAEITKDGVTVFEAEEVSSAKIAADPSASGGHYVTAEKEWTVLVELNVPSGDVPGYAVWARVRGGAMHLKCKSTDGTKELKVSYSKAEDWTWVNLGYYERAKLGDRLLVMRDRTLAANGGIDRIVLAADKSWKPESLGSSHGAKSTHSPAVTAKDKPATPEVGAPTADDATVLAPGEVPPEINQPGSATVELNWNTVTGTVSPYIYSMNTCAGFNPAKLDTPEWHRGINYLAPKLLRLHSSSMMKGAWWDVEAGGWKYDKIKESLQVGKPAPGTELLINIFGWPAAFDEDKNGRLDEGRLPEFVKLCADLVRYVNIELKMGVKYWEITNEKDGAYWRRPAKGLEADVNGLATIYNAAAKAMREVDPTIKIGGPAAMHPLPNTPLLKFAVATKDQLDFLSFHDYASGSGDETDQVIYEKTLVIARDTRRLAQKLHEAIPDKAIEIHLNEYNICYSWRIPEPRMQNYKGAVFDALALVAFSQVPGLTAANAWNDVERVYGKLDASGEFRPSAHVYHLMNAYFIGNIVESKTSAAKAVVPFAVGRGEGKGGAFVLINRTNAEQSVTVKSASLADGKWSGATVNAEGYQTKNEVTPFAAPLTLAPHSVNFYWTVK